MLTKIIKNRTREISDKTDEK